MSIDTIMKDSDYSVSDTDAIICRSTDTSGWTKSLISDPNIINSSSTSEDEYQQQQKISTGDDDLMIIASPSGESCSSVDSNNQGEQRIRILNVDMIMGWYSQRHECPICGLEFLSGQTLGGHVRGHRASIMEEDEYHYQQIWTAPGDCGGSIGDDLMIIVSSGESSSSANHNNQIEQRIRIFNVDMIMGLLYSQLPHECSICGLEFLNGQALEGHLRMHRASITSENLLLHLLLPPPVKPSNGLRFLRLDLNLEPWENDLRIL